MFSYDKTLESSKDKVRFYIQDTKENDYFFEDEEIEAFLIDYPNIKTCAIQLCYVLSTMFAGLPDDEKIGPYSVSYKTMSEKYLRLANTLRNQQSRVLKGYAGGVYKEDLEQTKKNNELTKTAFTRFMMRNYKGGTVQYEQSGYIQ